MKNKLITKIKNNFNVFILVAIISAAIFLCNYVESKACPVYSRRPEYIKGNYEVLNYFLDSLGINLPENFPPELKEHVSEGVFLLDSLEKRIFKERLRENLATFPDKKDKEFYFLAFCEYMRNLWIYERRLLSYDDKIVEWSREQGMENVWLHRNNCSFLINVAFDIIQKERLKIMEEILQRDRVDKLEENK